jgi:UDP-glucose 4-epimerase
VINIGGGSRATVNEIVRIMEEVAGRKADVRREGVEKGDVKHTSADIRKAQRLLNYSPKVSLKEGIRREYEWLQSAT